MKRQRGRGRKPSNPSNRSYESNGPDVKIRGNANQVYEKYLQYARDAQTSGDRIAAEAYFQHAEHYFRIMAANMPKDKPQNNQDDQNDASEEASVEERGETAAKSENSRQDQPSSEDVSGLQVVDGDGEQPDEIKSADNQDKPQRRRGRPRRKPTSEQQSDGEGEGDDSGLRAMMARSSSDDQQVETVEQADS